MTDTFASNGSDSSVKGRLYLTSRLRPLADIVDVSIVAVSIRQIDGTRGDVSMPILSWWPHTGAQTRLAGWAQQSGEGNMQVASCRFPDMLYVQ